MHSNTHEAAALFNATVMEIILKLVDDNFGTVGTVFTKYTDFYIRKKAIHTCHPLYARINGYFSMNDVFDSIAYKRAIDNDSIIIQI